MQGQIRARRLDPDLQLAYSDCLAYMEATQTYLESLNLLERQKSTGSLVDLITSAWNATNTGADAKSTASKIGLSDENAASAGKLIGAASFASNLYDKSTVRDANFRANVAAEERKLQDRWTLTESGLRTVAAEMGQRYGWSAGEAGFDGYRSTDIADRVDRSPRDPFLWADYGDVVLNNARSASSARPAVDAFLEAAQLVPAGREYDSLRIAYVKEATEAALYTASLESNSSYTALPASAGPALKLARTYLVLDAEDATGIGHADLARALGYSGRFQEAAESAEAAYNLRHDWAADPGFCLRYAKLLTLTGRPQMAPSWIEKAYHYGYQSVSTVRTDNDFAGLRRAQPQNFGRLTTVKTTWDIKFGCCVFDDVVLQNDSPFDLTNIKLHVRVRHGGSVQDRVLTHALLKAGTSYQFDSVLSHNERYEEATASITTDQD